MIQGRVTGTGHREQGANKYQAPLPEPTGRHLWVFTGVWWVVDPAREHQDFDVENLITVVGPGCLHCEQMWRPTIGAHCPGSPG